MHWINGTDLARWADLRDCQEKIPEVLRRLVHSTITKPQRVEFRSGEGAQLPGWDGIVETTEGNSWVPVGVSCWEIGTGEPPKAKAGADYEKRKNDPLGQVPLQTTFVFVTPRRWAGKTDWANKRRSEQHWADVKVYDAGVRQGSILTSHGHIVFLLQP